MTPARSRLVLVAVILAAALATPAAFAQAGVTAPGRPRLSPAPIAALAGGARLAGDDRVGSVVVRLRRGAGADAVVQRSGGRSTKRLPGLGLEVVSAGPAGTAALARRLRADPDVAWVEPNRVRYVSGNPDDVDLAYQSNIFATRLPAAWDLTHGSSTIDIAIVDTGVDLDHPDLAGRLTPGIDIVNGDSNPQDDEGHGTMVAGIAAALTNNARGIAGAAWNARIMPVKVIGSDGSGTDADAAEGIVWATDHGAEVINMSFGAPGSTRTLSDAIDYAAAHGVVLVAASGNESSDVPSYPAAYPSVISVGATDGYGDVVYFSNRGPTVDVVAPGWEIVSTALASGASDSYAVGDGTSFASPLVAGVAAMIRAKFPKLTPADVRARIKKTAIDRGPRGIDDHYGWGLVDAYASVGGRTAARTPEPPRDALEPNDVPSRASGIGDGVSSTISPEGDVDWFSYDATSDGAVTVTATPPALGSGSREFVPVVSAWTSGLDRLSDVSSVPVDGTVKVRVSSGVRYLFRVSSSASSRSEGPPADPAPYSVSAVFTGEPGTNTLAGKAWISDTVPAPFARDVSPSVSPTIDFARTIDPSSLNAQTVRLVDAKTWTVVASALHYDSGAKRVTIDPDANLSPARAYFVQVTGVTGSSQTMTERFTSRFSVADPAAAGRHDSDFNRDGFDDTVVAAPGEGIGTKAGAGVVHVFYGSASGVKTSGSQMWSQDTTGIVGAAASGDAFGAAVATGDLNNDGYDDLVVGVPGEDLAVPDAGAVHVILGSSSGLTASGNQLWTQDTTDVPGVAEAGDRFGATLAVGRFDNVPGWDVAIGAPGEAVGSASGAGSVNVLRGGSSGLTAAGAQLFTQNTTGIDLFADSGDGFGAALAAGDVESDGNDELAIGAPSDDISSGDEGSVTLLRGSVVGLRPAASFIDTFDSADAEVPIDAPEPGDGFGSSVAIADVGGYSLPDRYADLIVGVPGQDESTRSDAGKVSILFSDHSGPWLASETIDQSSFGLDSLESDSRFGSALAVAPGALAIGDASDDLPAGADAGRVHVYSPGGFRTAGDFAGIDGTIALTQDVLDVADPAAAGDMYGHDVALLDVDGDGRSDLVASSPFESVSGATHAGSVFVTRDVSGAGRTSVGLTQDSDGVASAAEPGDHFGAGLA